jgi:hypothetical protein
MTRIEPYTPHRLDLLRRVSYRVLRFRFGRAIAPGQTPGGGLTEGMYCVRPEAAETADPIEAMGAAR